MINNFLLDQLLSLGFSNHDAKIYLTLLEKGPSTAGPIIKAANLHRNIVYTSLDHLIARKLVTEKIVKGKKLFSLTNPTILKDEFEQKNQLANLAVKRITEKMTQEIQEINIYQGNDEYLRLLTSIIKSLPKGSTIYVLGTGGKDFMDYTMWPIWDGYHKVAFAQKIKIRMISYESQRSALNLDEHSKKIYEIKFLPSNIENPAGIHIYPPANTVLNIIYSDANMPVTAIKIKNKALTQGYLNLFNNLWALGKK